ncbi:MAG: hypothetical protein AB1758_36835 [Candidatus Eremiobacterota bacterium]
MRIDDASWHSSTLRHLEQSSSRLFEFREQVASGERVRRPSDDAAAYGRKLDRVVDLARSQGFDQRLRQESERMDAYDALLGDLSEFVRRARGITQQASNAATNAEALPGLAREVGHLLEGALTRANSEHHGRYLLGGTRSDRRPFEAAGLGGQISQVTYQGDRSFPALTLPDGRKLELNLHGEAVSAGGGPDLFATLIALRGSLESGTVDASTVLSQLAQIEQNLLERRVEAGAASRYLTELRRAAEDEVLSAQSLLADETGVDLAESVTGMLAAETSHQAILASSARSTRLSLVDYLR